MKFSAETCHDSCLLNVFIPIYGQFQSFQTKGGTVVRPGCIFDSGDGLKYAEDYTGCPDTANIVVGAIVKIPPSEEATTTEEQEGIGR